MCHCGAGGLRSLSPEPAIYYQSIMRNGRFQIIFARCPSKNFWNDNTSQQMKRIESFIARILKYGTLISTYGLIVSVCIQIFARFFLPNTPSWTEEAARLFFIYAISFAAGLALKNRYYVHLDLVYNRLSSRGKQWLDIGIPLLTFLMFTAMAIYTLPFIGMGYNETSPSMGLNMSVAFASMFVMAGSISFYAGIEVNKAIKHLKS